MEHHVAWQNICKEKYQMHFKHMLLCYGPCARIQHVSLRFPILTCHMWSSPPAEGMPCRSLQQSLHYGSTELTSDVLGSTTMLTCLLLECDDHIAWLHVVLIELGLAKSGPLHMACFQPPCERAVAPEEHFAWPRAWSGLPTPSGSAAFQGSTSLEEEGGWHLAHIGDIHGISAAWCCEPSRVKSLGITVTAQLKLSLVLISLCHACSSKRLPAPHIITTNVPPTYHQRGESVYSDSHLHNSNGPV